MRVIVSAERITPAIERHLDGRLVVFLPWDATATQTLAALHDLLTEVERVELEAALQEAP